MVEGSLFVGRDPDHLYAAKTGNIGFLWYPPVVWWIPPDAAMLTGRAYMWADEWVGLGWTGRIAALMGAIKIERRGTRIIDSTDEFHT